jgi:hypothetical protein
MYVRQVASYEAQRGVEIKINLNDPVGHGTEINLVQNRYYT